MAVPAGEVISSSQFVEVSRRSGGVVARVLTHALSTRESPIVEGEIRPALTESDGTQSGGLKFLVVDMTEVTYMSSAGIGILVGLHRLVKPHRAKFIVFGLNPELLELLKLTRLDRLFTIMNDAAKLEKKIQ